MGGGAGIGSSASVAPYDGPRISSSQRPDKSSESQVKATDRTHPPVGFKNIGNTCYANAALQCLLSTALSHALLDPQNAVIFRRYSSNPNLLAMGSGSVDSDEEEEDYLKFIENDDSRPDPKNSVIFRRIPSNPNPLVLGSASIDSDDEEGPLICLDGDDSQSDVHKLPPSVKSAKEVRREERRKKREAKLKAKEKLLNGETCSWLTGELTNITRLYTATALESKSSDSNNSTWSNLFTIFSSTSPPEMSVVDPGSITRHVHRLSPCLRPYQQEDAHEFLRALLSTLTMEGQNKQLSSLFDGLLESSVTCQTCNRASITRDRYMDLSLDIQQKNVDNLVSALQTFTEAEFLDNDNKVFCSRCQTKRKVSKGLRLATAPTILVCQLKRFAFDIYGRTRRLNKHVEYPLRLEIGEFMSRANRGKPPPYELVGVLVHTGQRCDSGHYLAYIKNGGVWYKANDSIVTEVDLETVLKQRAYILIYEVEGMRAQHGFHGYGRYHEKKSDNVDFLSRSAHNISWRKADDNDGVPAAKDRMAKSTTNVSPKDLNGRQPLSKAAEEKQRSYAATFLDKILNLCGSGSLAESVRDGICEPSKKEDMVIQNDDQCNVAELKRADPITSTRSGGSSSSGPDLQVSNQKKYSAMGCHENEQSGTLDPHHDGSLRNRAKNSQRDITSGDYFFQSRRLKGASSVDKARSQEKRRESKRERKTRKKWRSGSAPRAGRRSLSRKRYDKSLPPLPRRDRGSM